MNQLHPLSGATDIGQYDFYAESWNQEMNESSSDFSREASKSEAKAVPSKSPQFREEDETIEVRQQHCIQMGIEIARKEK